MRHLPDNYHGEAGFRAFSHYKSILDREVVPDPDVKYPLYTDEKLAILKSFVDLSAYCLSMSPRTG